MLADAERKVLRIIANYSAGRKRMPTLIELGRKTGKSQKKLLETLSELAKEGYISWTPADPDRITLLQAWEREDRENWWQMYGSR
ncbi:hypothetical protein C8Z91_06205 [Paenibacillus elgii]|uniref:HTH marR-type domain-containing protein n=1 Tax=Paenibacillus elgii TaxID=189691 RepID=A0A2T6G7G7_9BACL|nr:hypothetical protein [Paenibacillus elgii]PUA40086.1 hypothetical protein C8Z91_06205 [Paenibacillus elgii]